MGQMDIRQIVLDRLEEIGWSKYRLAEKECRGKVPQATVYDFLRGQNPINSDHLGVIFDLVGLSLMSRKA